MMMTRKLKIFGIDGLSKKRRARLFIEGVSDMK